MAPSQVPDIETERLILRKPTSADLSDWVACIWGDSEVLRYMPRMGHTPPDAFAEARLTFFTGLRERKQVGAWAITQKADGQFMGHCMLAHREALNEYELGYAFGKDFWGQGYATETARAVARFGFEYTHLDRIFAVVVPENTPSWHILERLGFVYEMDVTRYNMSLAYYALRREEFVPGDAFFRLYDAESS